MRHPHGQAEHVQIGKGVQHEEVHAAVDQAGQLLRVERFSLLIADLTQGAQRSS